MAASKHAGKRALRVRLTFRKPILRRDAALLCQGGRVRVVVLPSREVTGHASSGVVMDFLPRVTGADRAHVHIAHFSAGGTLGEHAAPMRQMFAILSGEGEVVSDGGEPRRVSAGQAVIWESGEVHQSWAVTEMVVVIVETTGSVDLDEHFAET